MNLAGFRDAVVDHFTSEFLTLSVSSHEGQFDLDAVRRYSKSDPALVISSIETTTDGTPIGAGILFDVLYAAVVLARSRAGEVKDSRALRIASFVIRELAKKGQVYGISDVQVQAPRKLKGRTLYSAELDGKGVALYGITWHQAFECTADSETALDDLEQLHFNYDLGPDPDGTYEAEDDIDLTE